jgi:hypothetical protein
MYTSHVASFMSGVSRITQFLLLTFEHARVLRIACLFDLGFWFITDISYVIAAVVMIALFILLMLPAKLICLTYLHYIVL